MKKLQSEELKKIRDLIQLKSGISIKEKKFEIIHRKKIEKLISEEGYSDFKTFYHDIVYNRKPELIQKLYNIVTINETYFFRENEHFRILTEKILPEINSIRPKGETINILSAPCSTGEEVYSILIQLLEENRLIKERDFMLLGIDIDSQVIKEAKKGVYTESSMRNTPEKIKSRYFKNAGNLYHIDKKLKDSVSFENVNVLDRYKMKKLGKFDVIFSRNMLIYFEENVRKEVIANFYSMLKSDGYLILSHVERIPESIQLFKKIKIGNSIIYKKNS
ncbi:chemotaxis protein methyltransferase CheR [Persephonella hydrogeniphila]|uniref:protein-glutamate O-methyltransferase n=1 Tax=Persephonella hydrogeniphila TaxID=198703 RepID=A0A285N1L9_9AQUI|nr:CheR family methyltransferase [Persephonella hydrogeniphila]SNZ03228.1 chemotaxis protein methyltransferase CheR [Persephonella hydrogeniphila]